jgi:5-methylthioribose kinase
MYMTQQRESTIAFITTILIRLNTTILNGFIGTEIMRRLIGLAQLPLKMELKTKAALLAFARDLILK